MIPIDECLDGHLYFIETWGLTYGIWNSENKAFEVSSREEELHWDADGRAKPVKMIEKAPVFAETNAGKHAKDKYFEEWNKAEGTIVQACGAVFLDLDGTVLNWMNGGPVANAVETVNAWARQGIQIIITTRRGHAWPDESPYSPKNTEALLRRIGLLYDRIVYDIHSPRMVINDEGAEAIHHPASQDWNYPNFPFDHDRHIPHDRELPRFGIAATITCGPRRIFYFHTREMGEAQSAMKLMGYPPEEYETNRFCVRSCDEGDRFICLLTDAEFAHLVEAESRKRPENSEE